MSETNHRPDTQSNTDDRERGTVKSYVTGFVLSLLYTAVPYYLVVSHTITGSLLLGTILGFAFLQMAVQIFFFLHLGRGPKPLYNVGFFIGTFGAILVVVVGSIFIMDHLHNNMSPTDKSVKLAEGEGIAQIDGEKTGACHNIRENHRVTIVSDAATPAYTEAHRCDTITFIDENGVDRKIAFGTYPQNQIYAGVEELVLRSGHGNTITMNQTGTYQFHDQLDPSVAGSFTVVP